MADQESILDKKTRTGVDRLFDDMVARAEKPEPKLQDFSDNKAYEQAAGKYHNNPLLERIQGIKAQRDQQMKDGASPTQAVDYYNYQISELKKSFMQGADGGYVDEKKMQDNQNSIMGSLMAFDIPGAMKALLLSIPFVGDLLGAAGKWGMSQFSGNAITFGEAQEKITLERSLQGALVNVGVKANPKYTQNFVNDRYSNIKDPNFKPEERVVAEVANPAAAKAQAKNAPVPQTPVQADTKFTAPNGADVQPQAVAAGGQDAAPAR